MLQREEINFGGYVMDTLEAAIWVMLHTNSYREAVLAAVNLGRDSDTTAAVVGGLAGLKYGIDDIPLGWQESTARLGYIFELSEKFYNKINDSST